MIHTTYFPKSQPRFALEVALEQRLSIHDMRISYSWLQKLFAVPCSPCMPLDGGWGTVLNYVHSREVTAFCIFFLPFVSMGWW